MKKRLLTLTVLLLITVYLQAQKETDAGNWKTWFITSGREYRLPSPSSYKKKIAPVISKQQDMKDTTWQQILYRNAGAPGYRWQEIFHNLWIYGTSALSI